MSKLLNWFRSLSKEKNLRSEIRNKIELYQKQVTEVSRRRNQMIANGVPEDKIILLDTPQKMLIFTNSEPVFFKSEFIIALSYFLDDVDRSKIMMTEEIFQYDIFRCKIGDIGIYCDISQ